MKRRMPKLIGFKVGKLTLRRGDLLVLRAPGLITEQTAKRLKDQFENVLEDRGIKIIILGDGLDLFKLTPPAK